MDKVARLLGATLLLAGCAAGGEERARPDPAQPAIATYTAQGLESVIGRTAQMLEAQFGKADLDVREGTARKLQFSGPACVLDTYLYPARGGGAPIVTWVDARRPDGGDFDRASCVAALTAARAR